MEVLSYCVGVLVRVCENTYLKLSTAIGLSVLSFLFDTLQRDALLAVFVLIIMDFITAIHAVIRTGEDIKSHKIFRSAVKVAMYFLLISAGYISESAIPLGFVDDTVIAFLAVTELISILENMAKAGFAIPKSLYEKLKELKEKV